jgi:hypothetical protein
MPANIPDIIYGNVYTAIQYGVANYNTAVGLTLAASNQSSAVTGILDNRGTGRQQIKTAAGPADFPLISLAYTGGKQSKTVTPTFQLQQGQIATDAIIPITVKLTLTIRYDPGMIQDSATTPLEAYINQAFAQTGYPQFGLNYVRSFEFTDRREDKVVEDKLGRQTVFTRDMVWDLWPHISVLQ